MMTPLFLISLAHTLPQATDSSGPPALITVPETFINGLEVLLLVATGALVAVTLNCTWPHSK